MHPRCKPYRIQVRLTILALAKVLLSMVCWGGNCFAQVPQGNVSSAVSSEAFLRRLPPGSLPTESLVPSFPTSSIPAGVSSETFLKGLLPGSLPTESSVPSFPTGATQAAYSANASGQPENVTTAQFAVPKMLRRLGVVLLIRRNNRFRRRLQLP